MQDFSIPIYVHLGSALNICFFILGINKHNMHIHEELQRCILLANDIILLDEMINF